MKRAPYAREVEKVLATGRQPNVWMYSGNDAWDRAKQCRRCHGPGSTLLLPPGEDPASYRWPAVDGLLLYTDTDTQTTTALVRALLTAGVRVVIEERPGRAVFHYSEGNQPETTTCNI